MSEIKDKTEKFLKDQFVEHFASQIRTIDENIIEDASKIILRLLYCISTSDKGIDMKKDETIVEALKWLKNHKTK